MKTYFITIGTATFGNQVYDTGYPGLIVDVPLLILKSGDKFSVEYLYNNKESVQLKFGLSLVSVEIFKIGNLLLQGKIKQVDC